MATCRLLQDRCKLLVSASVPSGRGWLPCKDVSVEALHDGGNTVSLVRLDCGARGETQTFAIRRRVSETNERVCERLDIACREQAPCLAILDDLCWASLVRRDHRQTSSHALNDDLAKWFWCRRRVNQYVEFL